MTTTTVNEYQNIIHAAMRAQNMVNTSEHIKPDINPFQYKQKPIEVLKNELQEMSILCLHSAVSDLISMEVQFLEPWQRPRGNGGSKGLHQMSILVNTSTEHIKPDFNPFKDM
jgi:hypothetical protein